jgi:hypothetical protein
MGLNYNKKLKEQKTVVKKNIKGEAGKVPASPGKYQNMLLFFNNSDYIGFGILSSCVDEVNA